MDENTLTEGEFGERLRRRRPIFPDVTVERPVTLEDVDADFRAARRKRSDIGIMNHALNLFLEPRNPFEPQRMRKPKMEATVFGSLLILVVLAVFAFNLAAPQF